MAVPGFDLDAAVMKANNPKLVGDTDCTDFLFSKGIIKRKKRGKREEEWQRGGGHFSRFPPVPRTNPLFPIIVLIADYNRQVFGLETRRHKLISNEKDVSINGVVTFLTSEDPWDDYHDCSAGNPIWDNLPNEVRAGYVVSREGIQKFCRQGEEGFLEFEMGGELLRLA